MNQTKTLSPHVGSGHGVSSQTAGRMMLMKAGSYVDVFPIWVSQLRSQLVCLFLCSGISPSGSSATLMLDFQNKESIISF